MVHSGLAPLTFTTLAHFPVSLEMRTANSAGDRRSAEIGKPRLDVGLGKRGIDSLVQYLDDAGRRVLGSADAVPRARLIIRDELSYGRDLR